MTEFLRLEAGYLLIAAFVLGVVAFITTRDFMPPRALRRTLPIAAAVLALFIALHYLATRHRIRDVTQAFAAGRTVLCENRRGGRANPSVEIRRRTGWRVEDGLFVNDEVPRPFHPARCVVAAARPAP